MDRVADLRELYHGRQLDEARKLYEREPISRDPEWYWIGSLMYWRLGQYPLSRWAADYGLRLGPVGEMRLKLLYRLGTTETTLGAHGEGAEHLEECLQGLSAHPALESVMRGALLNNLALGYYSRSENPESLRLAISYHEQAAEEFRRERMQEHLCTCLHSLAWVLCDTGHVDRAATVIDEAAPLCTTEQSRLRQTVANAYQMLMAGDCVRSLESLDPVLRCEDNSPAYIYALSVMAMASLTLRHHNPSALGDAQTLIRQAIYSALTPGVDTRCWTTANRVQKRVIAAVKEQNRGA